VFGLTAVSDPVFAHTFADLVEELSASVAQVDAKEWIVRGTDDREVVVLANQGSGVLISSDGKMLTVAHLVQSADEIQVQSGRSDPIRARVLASEPAADIALLQLERVPDGMRPARLGDSDSVSLGEQVLVMGMPQGIGPTATIGHLSGRHRPVTPFGFFDSVDFVRTDAFVAEGSSGAPLFNKEGLVIGIATGVQIKGEQIRGLGFAVTSNTIKAHLLDRKSLWSGMICHWIDGDLARALNIPQASGLLVERIASHSPASRLKLRAGAAPARVGDEEFILGGDIILEMQGVSLAEERGYQRARQALSELRPGDEIRVRILRAGSQLELSTPYLSGSGD